MHFEKCILRNAFLSKCISAQCVSIVVVVADREHVCASQITPRLLTFAVDTYLIDEPDDEDPTYVARLVMVLPPPPPRTKWTRRVPHLVLIGHAASFTPY